jgi:hypothetical protein
MNSLFEAQRNPDAEEELEALNFETSKMFVILSDGKIQGSNLSAQMKLDLISQKTELGPETQIVTVSQTGYKSSDCANGRSVALCPQIDFLKEIGDHYVDGGDVVDAAREVARIVNSKKCIR